MHDKRGGTMAQELTCGSCGAKTAFEDTDIQSGKAECPKCGSTIRVAVSDKLSETMRIDTGSEEE